MLKFISSIFSYLKKEKKFQVISEISFSYLKKAKKILVIKEILFSYLKKRSKIHIFSGFIFLFLIIILFSLNGTSDSDQNDKIKISTKLKEKNNHKSDDFSKSSEVKIKKKENKQAIKEKLSNSSTLLEKRTKKDPSKDILETQPENKVKQLTKTHNTKNKIKNSNTPKEVVNNLHIGLKKVSEKISDSPTDLIKLVKNTYNAEKMIAKIIGDTWKKTNKKDQEEIVLIFQEYIAKNYFKRFNKIQNPTFKYKESKKIGEKFMLVKTVLVVDKEDISISYLLLLDKNKWRIFDVLLAGSISEIATKKSEFSGFIIDEKITPLMNALKKQNLLLNN